MKHLMIRSLAAAAVLLSTCALADGPIGYPGSTWGQATFPSSTVNGGPDNHDVVYQGKITQGIDWFKFGGGKYTFDTYGSFSFTVDNKHLWWNDKVDPAFGAKISRGLSSGVVDIGIEGVYEHHFGTQGVTADALQNGFGAQVYVGYWFGWNLKK